MTNSRFIWHLQYFIYIISIILYTIIFMHHIESVTPDAHLSKKPHALRRVAAAASATVIILWNQGCGSVSWAGAGAAIWSPGGPVTSAAWAMIWAALGRSAEQAREREGHVNALFHKVPLALIKKSGTEWKALAHFVNAEDMVTFSPKNRKGNVVTFLVTAKYGKDGSIVWPVEIEKDISK